MVHLWITHGTPLSMLAYSQQLLKNSAQISTKWGLFDAHSLQYEVCPFSDSYS